MSDTSDSKSDAPGVSSADCYSGGERAMMEATQRARARFLGPFLQLLARAGVRANHVTVLSLIAGLSFAPLFFWSRPAALVLLALHVLLDGLDGPLARQLGTASAKGSLTDTMADQLVVTATTVTLMLASILGVLPGALYVFLYAVVVAFAMVRNAMNIPYSWLFRPRFLVYAWILCELYLWPGTIDYVIWLCNILLAAKLASGFVKIRGTLS